MNVTQRKLIDKMISDVEQLKSEIENMQSDEQDKFDNMTEGLQQGERGQVIEAAVNALDSAATSAQELIDYLSEAKDGQ